MHRLIIDRRVEEGTQILQKETYTNLICVIFNQYDSYFFVLSVEV